MPTLAFSPVCIPDIHGLRRLYALPDDLADDEVAELAWQRSRGAGQGERLPPYQYRVVSIACARRDESGFQLFTLSGEESSILQRFFTLCATATTLIDWDAPGASGVGVWPILQTRAVLAQAAAPTNAAERLNLPAALGLAAGPTCGATALAQMLRLADLPNAKDMPDAQRIWQQSHAGGLNQIEIHNDARVLGQYLLWQRLRLLRGEQSSADCLTEYALLRQHLTTHAAPHLQAWLDAWPAVRT